MQKEDKGQKNKVRKEGKKETRQKHDLLRTMWALESS
jgi:hypothetical protein